MSSTLLHVSSLAAPRQSLPHPLQDPMAASHPPAPAGPRFRPYASQKHQVTKGRYITSNDPRGYMFVLSSPPLHAAHHHLAPCTSIRSTVSGS